MAGYMSASVFPKGVTAHRLKGGETLVVTFSQEGDDPGGSGMKVFLQADQIAVLTDLLVRESTRHWKE